MVPVTSGQTSIYTSLKVLAHHDAALMYIHTQPCTSIYRPFMGLRRHRSTSKTSHPYMCFSCKNKKNGSKNISTSFWMGKHPKAGQKTQLLLSLQCSFLLYFLFSYFLLLFVSTPHKSVRADQYCRPALGACFRLLKVPALYYTRSSTTL